MARTPLLDHVQRAAGEVAASEGPGLSRAELLKRTGAAGLGLAAFGRLAASARGATNARIVVVGAGLAGLACAYRLRQVGFVAEVHEASNRLGGRCWTGRGFFSGGQIYEHGGELIDQGHTQIRNLAHELGLRLDNLLRAEPNDTELIAHIDGAPYTYAEITDDIKKIWQKIHSDVSAASFPTLFDSSTERGRELDQLSIIDWLNESIPGGGASTRLGKLLDVAYNIEYGLECSEQSSLNLLYLIGYVGQGQFRAFGKSDERYHVRGGNDQIVSRMAASLPGQITTRSELVEVKRLAGDRYELTFRQGSRRVRVTADKVVLALPFSILRDSVDLSAAGFSARKLQAIDEQGMGTNSKLQLQFTRRYWNELGGNGDTYADTGYQATWEVSRAQPGSAGILVDYTGGEIGDSFHSGTLTERAEQFLEQIDPVFPDLAQFWNGTVTLDYWPGNEWARGSYSCYKVGQYTAFAGIEERPERNAHFCGEHTSIDFQGYLNGAVETGERAAAEVIADLR